MSGAESSHEFGYTVQELTSIAEDMLDGGKQSVPAEQLLRGLASTPHSGIVDGKEQLKRRKDVFGENRLPNRKEVDLGKCPHNICYSICAALKHKLYNACLIYPIQHFLRLFRYPD